MIEAILILWILTELNAPTSLVLLGIISLVLKAFDKVFDF